MSSFQEQIAEHLKRIHDLKASSAEESFSEQQRWVHENTVDQAALRIMKYKKQKDAYVQLVGSLQKRMDELFLEKAKLEVDIKAYEDSATIGTQAENNNKINRLEAELSELKCKNKEEEKMYNELLSTKAQLIKTQQEEIDKLNRKLSSPRETDSEMSRKNAQLQQEVESITNNLLAERETHRIATEQRQALQNTVEKYRKELENAQAYLQEQKKELEEARKKVHSPNEHTGTDRKSKRRRKEDTPEPPSDSPSGRRPASPMESETPGLWSLPDNIEQQSPARSYTQVVATGAQRSAQGSGQHNQAESDSYRDIRKCSPVVSQARPNYNGPIYIIGIAEDICKSNIRFFNQIKEAFGPGVMHDHQQIGKGARRVMPTSHSMYMQFLNANEALSGTQMLGGKVGDTVFFLSETNYQSHRNNKVSDTAVPPNCTKLLIRELDLEMSNEMIEAAIQNQFKADPKFIHRNRRKVKGVVKFVKSAVVIMKNEAVQPMLEKGLLAYGKRHPIVLASNTNKKIPICYRCQGWGHSAYECKRPFVCLHCGQNHRTGLCQNKAGNKICANCRSREHLAFDTDCPAYKQYSAKAQGAGNSQANHKVNSTAPRRNNTYGEPAQGTNRRLSFSLPTASNMTPRGRNQSLSRNSNNTPSRGRANSGKNVNIKEKYDKFFDAHGNLKQDAAQRIMNTIMQVFRDG